MYQYQESWYFLWKNRFVSIKKIIDIFYSIKIISCFLQKNTAVTHNTVVVEF